MEQATTLFILLSTLLLAVSVESPQPPLFPDEALPTKSGYLPVKPAPGSSMFYAFYEAQEPTTPLPDTPLLVWLQGGPGCSSMIGNFYELGPWRVVSRATDLERNPGAWNRLFGLLFVDNPIGVGFSIAASQQDIPTNQRQVAEHLYAALVEFLEQNPSFENRPVYFTGESYAGKYVPAIGYYILKEKPNGKVNLKGLAIGNGLTDPVTQVQTHAVNVYYSGLVNAKQRVELQKAQEISVALVKSQKWREAADARTELLTLLSNMTGLATLYNTARAIPYRTDLVVDLLNQREAKRVLGVSETVRFEECSDEVEDVLRADVMKSVKFMVEYALERTQVLLYQGMLDLRDGVVSTEEWMKTMNWSGLGMFSTAERRVWKDEDGVVAGYVQRWGNLCHVAVTGAGHFVPTDKAVNSRDMIEGWVLGKGLFGGKDVKQTTSSSLYHSI
ncbi:Serine carboxypeptidase-like 50 [Arabidopsis thaliana]|jgi:vitellogenic carboxypeptidase-like protein|uniref:Serine carboxypeptidase-like 50 n=4 Tax=Arabidopsis TaxID=3701 RepID=SCP50_ARATH|nr:serine carboxypeptidase-like 50 [Arabidopsis thaliana]Q9M9Q6.1 RecName: Full=Serine carboxypeptidase-like 50; Flags: Precursor [Arabidopsis thaliana]KAG7646372.1 Alpha/Beta hydrolase fold [Arabidopsis thaliana x Arabidopsis arenosa]KAG7654348.1 Alpha/Beta hydrolase fold [Arabidopsis suecica]AAF31022.1 Contains similarity to serine-type carboxypeptidase like protein from Arabidopsis thaliana gi/4678929 and contains two Serine carboxypeptidase domains PF/00450 [Arabidopsis thaliana]AAL91626.1|eukprot:NP_172953.1 serine carboxypeptidase-like 50 [Arabidopsis thaliana]